MSDTETHWLTQEAFDRLTTELEERTTVKRTEITRLIELAREEGDLKENGGYHAAKDDQGRNEARIRELQHIINHSQIGRPPEAEAGLVTQGSVIVVEFPDGRVEDIMIASREEKAHTDLRIVTPESPLGKALMGQTAETEVSYELPNGTTRTVRLMKVRH